MNLQSHTLLAFDPHETDCLIDTLERCLDLLDKDVRNADSKIPARIITGDKMRITALIDDLKPRIPAHYR